MYEAFGRFFGEHSDTVLAVLIATIVAAWFVDQAFAKRRIAKYIEKRGGHLASLRWAPFGKGWFRADHYHIYNVGVLRP